MAKNRNTTNRLYVEKLGATKREEFTGNKGEVFYDPTEAELYLSDGEKKGGTPIVASAIENFVIDTSGKVMPINLNKLGTLP